MPIPAANKSLLDEAIGTHQKLSAPSQAQRTSYQQSLQDFQSNLMQGNLVHGTLAGTSSSMAAAPTALNRWRTITATLAMATAAIGLVSYFEADADGTFETDAGSLIAAPSAPERRAHATEQRPSPVETTEATPSRNPLVPSRRSRTVRVSAKQHAAARVSETKQATSRHSLLVRAEWALRGGQPLEARTLLSQFTQSGRHPKKAAALEVLIACRLGEDTSAALRAFLSRYPRSSFGERFRRECPSPL